MVSFIPLLLGKEPIGIHWIGGWVGPGAELDAVEKREILLLPGIEPRLSSPSLYRLSYPGCQPCS
jgi:hypothetical protein